MDKVKILHDMKRLAQWGRKIDKDVSAIVRDSKKYIRAVETLYKDLEIEINGEDLKEGHGILSKH